jgi:hypothetical protein
VAPTLVAIRTSQAQPLPVRIDNIRLMAAQELRHLSRRRVRRCKQRRYRYPDDCASGPRA